MNRRFTLIIVVIAISLIAAGCGGKSSVSSSDRMAACLKKQPDATKADCAGWENDGMLGDDGAHKGHEGMSG